MESEDTTETEDVIEVEENAAEAEIYTSEDEDEEDVALVEPDELTTAMQRMWMR